MNAVTSTTSRSTTLAALRAEKSDTESDESDAEVAKFIASNTRQVNTDTTITTVVMSSADSRLPNLSLQDVLERSGVEENAIVLLQTDSSDDSMIGQSPNEGLSDYYDAPEGTDEQIQEAIESIEATGTVVVHVETTDNVQTVKVRAVDIDTVYTQATTLSNEDSSSYLSNFLLLKNGWAYTNMESSPLDLPIEPPEQISGNGWTVWRSAEDGAHEIQDTVTGLWNRLTGQVVDTSPKSAAEVAGVFSNHTVDDQMQWTATSSTTLQLSPDGIFTNTRTSLTTSNNVLSDTSYTFHTLSSPTKSSNSFSSTSQPGGTQTATLGGHSQLSNIAGDMFGSYRILEDGITLQLDFADGGSERKLFLQTSEDNLTIGGQEYLQQGDVSIDLLGDLMRLVTESGEKNPRGLWLKALADAMRESAKTVTKNANQQQGNMKSKPESDMKLPDTHIENPA